MLKLTKECYNNKGELIMSFKFFLQYCENIKNEPLLIKIKSLLTYFKIAFDGWTDYYLLPLILFLIIFTIVMIIKIVYRNENIKEQLKLDTVGYDKVKLKKEMLYTKCYDIDILHWNKSDFKCYYNDNKSSYNQVKSEECTDDPHEILNNNEYYHYLRYVKANQKYKNKYFPGIIGWMTSYFWVPFLLGIISYGGDSILSILFNGVMCTVLIITLTGGVLLIPTFVIGVLVYPAFLKYIYFSTKYPMCEHLLNEMHHGLITEKLNIASVLGGTALGKFLNK